MVIGIDAWERSTSSPLRPISSHFGTKLSAVCGARAQAAGGQPGSVSEVVYGLTPQQNAQLAELLSNQQQQQQHHK